MKFVNEQIQKSLKFQQFTFGVIFIVLFCCSSNCLSIEGSELIPEQSNQLSLEALLNSAVEYKTKKDFLKARELYQSIFDHFPNYSQRKDIERQIWDLNVAIIFSSLTTSQSILYTVEPNDTLGKIAHKFSTTVELIKRRNNLSSHLIYPNQKLSIWKNIFEIVVDKSDNLLTLRSNGEIIKIYKVSTGRNNSSPVGNFTIKDRYTDPVWFHKGEVVESKSPKNYLGTRWLGFNLPQYGIHGTIEPNLIGQQVSSGCIRMRNKDVQELYVMIPIGTHVSIVE